MNLQEIKEQEASEASTFKIALISDTHNYYEDLDRLVNTINANGPYSFVIVSGDITNLGLLEEFDRSRSFFNQFNSPYLVAVGNHDLLANGDRIFSRMFGERNFSFAYKGVNFIFLNSNNWESPGAVPDMSFLSAKLALPAPGGHVLVAHVPPTDRDRFTDSFITDFENLINQSNVRYIINGHNHNPGEGTFGGAVQITVGSPPKGAYYELIVSPGGISHQKINF